LSQSTKHLKLFYLNGLQSNKSNQPITKAQKHGDCHTNQLKHFQTKIKDKGHKQLTSNFCKINHVSFLWCFRSNGCFLFSNV